MEHLKRATGLLVIEVINSNPNGDPEYDGSPRQRIADNRGEISPVSVKRKLRDLIEYKDGPVWQTMQKRLHLPDEEFMILESRGRDRDAINEMSAEEFTSTFWDARVFGNTFLESLKKGDMKGKDYSHYLRTGAVQVGMGLSVAPIQIEQHTTTNKAGVEKDKDRGLAPLAYKIVSHGVYTIPFFVNPTAGMKSGCTQRDLDLLLGLLPYVYSHTASYVRTSVEIRHAWYLVHQDALGSISDFALIDALTPHKISDPKSPSLRWDEYDVPTELPEEYQSQLSSWGDILREPITPGKRKKPVGK